MLQTFEQISSINYYMVMALVSLLEMATFPRFAGALWLAASSASQALAEIVATDAFGS